MHPLIIMYRVVQLVACVAAAPQRAGEKRKLKPETSEKRSKTCNTDNPMIPISNDDLFETMQGSINFLGALAKSCGAIKDSLGSFKNGYTKLCSARYNACLEGTMDPDAAISSMSSEDRTKHASSEADRIAWDKPYSNSEVRKEILAVSRVLLRNLFSFERGTPPFKDLLSKMKQGAYIEKLWRTKAYEGERLDYSTHAAYENAKRYIFKAFSLEFDKMRDRANCMLLGPELFGKHKFIDLVCLNHDGRLSIRELTKELIEIFWDYHQSVYTLYEKRGELLTKYVQKCRAFVEGKAERRMPNLTMRSIYVTEVVNSHFASAEEALAAYLEKFRSLQEAIAQKIQELGGLAPSSSK
ncbi:hypothetical protein PAPHI01_1486 [Pancytospora philotis]|nr:hypothetical protein PAPHI01_1486 [Pancytospora philotis]